MTVFQPQLQLAANHNNTAGYVVLQSVIPSGSTFPFPPADTYGTYQRGERLARPNGRDFWRGQAFTQFIWRAMPWVHDSYLRQTFCGDVSNYDGLVTVRLQTETPGTYANYNATMKLPIMTDLARRKGMFIDYVVTFIDLGAI